MNWLDILLIVVLLFSAVRSFQKGFSREIVGLAASFFALILAMWFYGIVGSYAAPYVSSVSMANLIGFVLVVVAVLMVGAIVGSIVSRFIRTIGLSFFDRLLGAGFGLLRGLLIAIALLTAYLAFGPHAQNDSTPEAVIHSRIAPWILEASRGFVAIAPMDLKVSFRKQYSDIRSALTKEPRGK